VPQGKNKKGRSQSAALLVSLGCGRLLEVVPQAQLRVAGTRSFKAHSRLRKPKLRWIVDVADWIVEVGMVEEIEEGNLGDQMLALPNLKPLRYR
jgi:hypothetical protein